MFSKTKRRSGLLHDTLDGSKAAPPSLISPSLRIVGNLRSQGEVQIDRTMDGDVLSSTLTIGEKGTINGEIVADDVVVRGRVNGRIRAGKVQLARSAYVVGEIRYNISVHRHWCSCRVPLQAHRRTGQDNRASHQTATPGHVRCHGRAARRRPSHLTHTDDVRHITVPEGMALRSVGARDCRPTGADTWPDPTTQHRQIVAATTIRVGAQEAVRHQGCGQYIRPDAGGDPGRRYMYGIAREMGVASRRLDLGMPEQFVDHGQALAKRQGAGCERMTEVMKPDILKPGARSYDDTSGC